MTATDVPGADHVSFHHLMHGLLSAGETPQSGEARRRGRITHVLETDPGGAWVAADRDGVVVGVALALLREGVWGLSLFAVHQALQGRGIGRRLLDACLDYGRDAHGRMILSSENPKAMRRYAHAGLSIRPCVSCAGMVDRGALREQPEVREGTPADFGWMDEISRTLRGAGHGRDLPELLAHGARLLVLPERAFAVHARGLVILAGGRRPADAAAVLEACLLDLPPGGTAEVGFIAAGNDWAVEVALRARLALSPDGPLFVQGRLGTMAPYLPSGAFL
jgi:GNAT superfamily N-acetyltransferase